MIFLGSSSRSHVHGSNVIDLAFCDLPNRYDITRRQVNGRVIALSVPVLDCKTTSQDNVFDTLPHLHVV